MAITALNIISPPPTDANLVALSSPLVYLIEATYTDTPPDYIFCEVTESDETLVTMRLPYVFDTATNKRVFRMEAYFLKAFVVDIDDIEQEVDTIIPMPISHNFTIVFKSDLSGSIQTSINVEAINIARNIDEDIFLSDIKNNEEKTYYAAVGEDVYTYYYTNELILENSYALDYDDANFVDYNDDKFVID